MVSQKVYISSWTQELGRVGKDRLPATATILYKNEDVQNAKSWIKNHLHNPPVRDGILIEFSKVWRYVASLISFKCKSELAKLLKALETFGGIREVTLAEWLTGSKLMLVGLTNTIKSLLLMKV